MKQRWQVAMAAGIMVAAVALDQALKMYVVNHFTLGEGREITSWFWLCYIENNGMAFGIQWFSKLLLTLFRIAAVGVLCYYMVRLVQREARTGYIASVALLTGGALGNIVDCVAYGKLFGYADWCYGRVVDMLYFPLIKNAAGECIFFRPVFNLADSCVTVAVAIILIWFRKEIDRSMQ